MYKEVIHENTSRADNYVCWSASVYLVLILQVVKNCKQYNSRDFPIFD